MKTSYQNGKIKLVPIEKWHEDEIIKNLRQSDRDEAWKSWRLSAEEVVRISVRSSEDTFTILYKGEPIGIFGVARQSLISDRGMIWFLGTDQLEKIWFSFGKETKSIMKSLMEKYQFVANWVDGKNRRSIAWLKRSGFQMNAPEPYGVYGEKFCYFWWKNEKRAELN